MQQTYSSTTKFLPDQRTFTMGQVSKFITQQTIGDYPKMELVRNRLRTLDPNLKVVVSSLKSRNNDKILFADSGQQVTVDGIPVNLHVNDRVQLFNNAGQSSIAENKKRLTESQIRQVIREELIDYLNEAYLREPVKIGGITVQQLISAQEEGKQGKQYADPGTGERRPAEANFGMLLRSIKNKQTQLDIMRPVFGSPYVVVVTDEGGKQNLTLDQDVLPVIIKMGLIQ